MVELLKSSKSKRIGNFALLMSIVLFFTFVIPKAIGLGKGGFDLREIFDKYLFYLDASVSALILLFIFVFFFVVTYKDSKYGDNNFFSTQGEFPSLPVFKNYSMLQLALLSIIISMSLGAFAFSVNQQAFTDSIFLEQQFTAVDNIIFSIFLVVGSENLGFASVILFSILFLQIFARRTNMTRENFQIFSALVIIIPATIISIANHALRYSDSVISLTKVGFFWTIGGFITFITGSFIPFYIMHAVNNLYLSISIYFSNSLAIIFLFSSIAVASGIYIWLYGFNLKGVKNKSE